MADNDITDDPFVVDYDDLTLFNGHVEGRHFGRRKAVDIRLMNSEFINCTFDHWTVRNITRVGRNSYARFIGCTFSHLRASYMRTGGVEYINCQFKDAIVKRWDLTRGTWRNCTFTGTIREGVVWGYAHTSPDHEPNECVGNDFSGLSYCGLEFRGGVDLSANSLPTGDDYVLIHDAAHRLTHVRDHAHHTSDHQVEVLASLALDNAVLGPGQEPYFLFRLPDVNHADWRRFVEQVQ